MSDSGWVPKEEKSPLNHYLDGYKDGFRDGFEHGRTVTTTAFPTTATPPYIHCGEWGFPTYGAEDIATGDNNG